MSIIVNANSWVADDGTGRAELVFDEPFVIDAASTGIFLTTANGYDTLRAQMNVFSNYQPKWIGQKSCVFSDDMRRVVITFDTVAERIDVEGYFLSSDNIRTKTNTVNLTFYEITTKKPEDFVSGALDSILIHYPTNRDASLWIAGADETNPFEQTYRCSYLYDTGRVGEDGRPSLKEFAFGMGVIFTKKEGGCYQLVISPILIFENIEPQEVFFFVEVQGTEHFYRLQWNGTDLVTDNSKAPRVLLNVGNRTNGL